jgi:hypothetical protein
MIGNPFDRPVIDHRRGYGAAGMLGFTRQGQWDGSSNQNARAVVLVRSGW